ncbi:IS4 family transposase, partial [Vibrio vulnificus]
INALFLIMDEMIWASDTRSPGAIPKNLKILRDSGKRLILPKKTKPKTLSPSGIEKACSIS